MADLKPEMLSFPHGRYDDQVDSISQFGEWVGRGRFHRGLERNGDGPSRYR